MTDQTARLENAGRENAGYAIRFPTNGFNPKSERVIKIFMSLPKYYYNTTYLFSLNAPHNPVIFSNIYKSH